MATSNWNHDSLYLVVRETCEEVIKLSLQPDDDFLSLGVSSMQVAAVRARLMSRLDRDIPLRLLLETENISSLCGDLLRLTATPDAKLSRIRPRKEAATSADA